MIQYQESKLFLRFQTHNKENSKLFRKTLKLLSKSKNLQFSSISLPIERKRFTVLKSPHVNKKAKEQYEIRFYNGLIVIKGNFLKKELIQSIHAFMSSDLLVKVSFCSNLCSN
ncbi:30S ribosomal protein S10 (mitochondrion) [Nannochloropsis oceanica]|uniref:30S ribosomal protein S10 n=1 Tax=Nannochloropsis oceanica TaxID=145522 RepID=T1R7I2_9STRA|nr:30S ribosomal protein S10 [Nannochloropsis oceanica]AHX24937.1 30S ribosomal protein S10 [Nannochloropsis oceanica]